MNIVLAYVICGCLHSLIGVLSINYLSFSSIHREFLSTWYQSRVSTMATNKDRIEKLESEMQELKEVVQKMNMDSQASFVELKELFFKGFEKGESSTDKEKGLFQSHGNHNSGHSNGSKGSNNYTKLEFPRYSGDDPNVWLNRVVQYFDYKQIPEEQKVSLAAFHLESEANQWWQWVGRL
jgi:TolA-binding protein